MLTQSYTHTQTHTNAIKCNPFTYVCLYICVHRKNCLRVMHRECDTAEVMRMQLARWHRCFSNMAASLLQSAAIYHRSNHTEHTASSMCTHVACTLHNYINEKSTLHIRCFFFFFVICKAHAYARKLKTEITYTD